MSLVIPGYGAAVRRENEIRDRAFLPLTEIVCGLECLPFTPRHFLILDQANSPFIKRTVELPTYDDILAFFWVISPQFRIGRSTWNLTRRFFRQRKIHKVISKRDAAQSLREINEYLNDAWQDQPPSVGSPRVPTVSYLVGYVDFIASEYGWTADIILALPFKQLFGYIKRINERQAAEKGARVPRFNPSDRWKGDFLRKLNEQRNGEAHG